MTDTITVRGFAGTAPEHRTPASGTEVTTLRLGSTPRWRNSQTGEWNSGSTNWYTVAAFGRLAENVAESISKGDPIVVVGRPKVRQWENDDGIRGTDVEISAQSVAHDLTYGRSTFTKVSLAPRAEDQQDAQSQDSQPQDELNGSAPDSQQEEPDAEQSAAEQQAGSDPAEAAGVAQSPSAESQQTAAEPQYPWNGDPSLQRAG